MGSHTEWREKIPILEEILDVKIISMIDGDLVATAKNYCHCPGATIIPTWLAQKIIALQTEIDDLHEY